MSRKGDCAVWAMKKGARDLENQAACPVIGAGRCGTLVPLFPSGWEPGPGAGRAVYQNLTRAMIEYARPTTSYICGKVLPLFGPVPPMVLPSSGGSSLKALRIASDT